MAASGSRREEKDVRFEIEQKARLLVRQVMSLVVHDDQGAPESRGGLTERESGPDGLVRIVDVALK